MGFWNTIGLKGKSLSKAIETCKTQEAIVMELFISKSKNGLTPVEVHNLFEKYVSECPLTSIRRALTNLTNKNLLIKTDAKRIGKYGVENYVWKLKKS